MKNILAENMRRFGTKNLPVQEQRVEVGNLETRNLPPEPYYDKPVPANSGETPVRAPLDAAPQNSKLQGVAQKVKSVFQRSGTALLNAFSETLKKITGFTFNLYSVAPGNMETNGNNPMITGFTITNIKSDIFNKGYATFFLILKNPMTSTNKKLNATLTWDSNKPNEFTIKGTEDLGFRTNPAIVYNEKFSTALMTEFNKLRNDPKADFAQNDTSAPTNNIA